MKNLKHVYTNESLRDDYAVKEKMVRRKNGEASEKGKKKKVKK